MFSKPRLEYRRRPTVAPRISANLAIGSRFLLLPAGGLTAIIGGSLGGGLHAISGLEFSFFFFIHGAL